MTTQFNQSFNSMLQKSTKSNYGFRPLSFDDLKKAVNRGKFKWQISTSEDKNIGEKQTASDYGYRQFIEYPLEDEIQKQKLKRYTSPKYDHDTSPYNVIATYPYHNENDIYNLYLIYKDNTESSGFVIDEENKIVYVVRNILEYREENEDMIIVPLEYLRILDFHPSYGATNYSKFEPLNNTYGASPDNVLDIIPFSNNPSATFQNIENSCIRNDCGGLVHDRNNNVFLVVRDITPYINNPDITVLPNPMDTSYDTSGGYPVSDYKPFKPSGGARYKYRSDCDKDPTCNVLDKTNWEFDDIIFATGLGEPYWGINDPLLMQQPMRFPTR